LTPSDGVVVSSKFGWQLKRKIVEALQRLNASHPAMKELKLAGWTNAANYASALTALEHAGVVYEDDAGKKRCRDAYEMKDIFMSIQCPGDHYKVPYDVAARQCEVAGLACPPGVICFCQPCVAKPKNIFSWEVVVGLCAALYGVGLFYLALGPLRERGRGYIPRAATSDDGLESEVDGPLGSAGRRRVSLRSH